MREDEALVTVAIFDTTFDASLARGALEAIGIRALVPEEKLVRSPVIATAARLQVFESDRARAEVELRRMQIRVLPPPSERD